MQITVAGPGTTTRTPSARRRAGEPRVSHRLKIWDVEKIMNCVIRSPKKDRTRSREHHKHTKTFKRPWVGSGQGLWLKACCSHRRRHQCWKPHDEDNDHCILVLEWLETNGERRWGSGGFCGAKNGWGAGSEREREETIARASILAVWGVSAGGFGCQFGGWGLPVLSYFLPGSVSVRASICHKAEIRTRRPSTLK